jgi:hypothetical protein
MLDALMGNLFWRKTDHKKRVNKKQNVELDSPSSDGGQGKYKKYVSFPWPLLEAALSMFYVSLFCKKQNFEK